MLTVDIGQSITIPARVITPDSLRNRLVLAQVHGVPDSEFNTSLKVGAVAKVLNAYPLLVRGLDEPIVEVSYSADEVTITGRSHGLAHVEIVDELSAPWAINGQGGGVEVQVEDVVDRMLRQAKE